MKDYTDAIAKLEQQLATLKKECKAAVHLPEMISIPDREYSVSETPVTVAQYEYFCNETKRDFPEQPSPSSPNNPVVSVSWQDAQDYCTWLSHTTDQTCRLPVEDEYEHFCGDHQRATSTTAVYDMSTIQPTKTKEPNKYGLYDVLGLVWEWQGNQCG